jgi:type I restriction enzyme, S subunit
MTNDNGKWPLPEGWVWTTLGEVTDPTRERVKPPDYSHLPFIGMDDVESQTMRLLSTKSSADMKSSAERFRPDDVLYGSLRPYLNKVYRPDFEGLASAEFIVFRKVPQLESRYLQYFLNQWSFVEFINRQNTGDRPRVKFSQMEDHPIPLAPLPEQQRIVAEIEKQFTRLDAAVAALKRARAGLARYKAAVLKAAVEGRLVPQDPADEPAAVLLQRILAERRAKWEAANPKKQYIEPKRPEVAGLPELPEGWVWVNLDIVAHVTKLAGFEYTKFVRYSEDGDLPVVKAENVGKGQFEETEYSFVKSDSVDHLVRSKLVENDLLMVFIGANLGNVALLPRGRTFFLGPNVALIRTTSEYLIPRFLEAYLRSPIGFNFTRQLSRSTAQGSISMGSIRQIPIAIPPVPEQWRIAEEIDFKLSISVKSESSVDAKLARSERLRQAVLAKAFRGELV